MSDQATFLCTRCRAAMCNDCKSIAGEYAELLAIRSQALAERDRQIGDAHGDAEAGGGLAHREQNELGGYVLRIDVGGGTASLPAEPGERIETGRLASGDRTLRTGEYYDEYSLQGRRGQRLTVDLSSQDFDPYVMVVPPDGKIEWNDDRATQQATVKSRNPLGTVLAPEQDATGDEVADEATRGAASFRCSRKRQPGRRTGAGSPTPRAGSLRPR